MHDRDFILNIAVSPNKHENSVTYYSPCLPPPSLAVQYMFGEVVCQLVNSR